MLNHVNSMNHEASHYMIQALSMTDEGRKLVKALEDIRYYHRHAEVYDLGYGGVLVEAFDEDTDGDRYWEGSVLIPSQRDGILNAIAAECESQGLTEGYASTWETLTVLKEIGGNVEKFLD